MPIVLVYVQFGCLFVMMLGSGVGFRPRSPAEFRTTPVGNGLIKGTQFQLIEIEGIAGDGGVVWLALLFDQIFRVSPKTSTAICPATSNLCFSPVPLHKLDH